MNTRLYALVLVALVCASTFIGLSQAQDDEEDDILSDLEEKSDEGDSELNKLLKKRLTEALASSRAETKTSTLRLERDHIKAIGFDEDIDNVCLREVTMTANNSDIWKVVAQYGGWIGVRSGAKKIPTPPKSRSYLTEKDVDFLESSWCNRNGQWSTYSFVGPRILRPEKEMSLVSDWKKDILDTIAQASYADRKVVYLATVPSILRAEDAPNIFFYNTHWFTVQLIPDRDEPGKGNVRIYAGFARHYRMVDYLGEWNLNKDIPATHRLKMDRTNWAGIDIPLERFTGEFLDKAETFINEINEKMEWTRLANDLHAELWYADKFKDMVILDRAKRKAAKEKRPEGATMTDNASLQDHEVVSLQVPYFERWKVPLARPSDGKGYNYEIRKYHYADEDCVKYNREMRTRMYGFSWNPAKPFKMTPEDYDTIDGLDANSPHPEL